MNAIPNSRRFRVLAGLVFCLLLATVCVYLGREGSHPPTQRDHATKDKATASSNPPSESSTGTQPSRQEQENAMTHLLNNMKAGLAKAGVKETPPVAVELREAAASKDHSQIRRAFNDAIYGRSRKMSEVLPIVKGFLADPDPYVRLIAAKTLYTAGDRSGFEALSALVSIPAAIPDGEQDLRVEAAQTLAKFRETEAVDRILALYSQSKNRDLLTPLATLGVRAPEAKAFPFVASDLAITKYAKYGAAEFVPKIEATFQQSRQPRVKNAAAWALARFGQPQYADYLVQAAEVAINAPATSGKTWDDNSAALRYLGSLQIPVARAVLERALHSDNPVAVEYAVVNLLFNQPGGSEEAKRVVIRELRGEQRKMEYELLFNVASKLDDPEVCAAGEAFDQRSDDHSWQLHSRERRAWPIYNWIDGYVVALSR
jgi:HEAT repeat protein